MEDQKWFDIIKQGPQDWNSWRAANHNIIPDLSGAELSNLNLEGINLSEAILSETNFYYTNLQKADLSKANLFRAKLDGANLRGADLSGADLREAHLSQWDDGDTIADLRSANLSEADLSGADLRNANLNLANLSKSNLSGTDLTRARIYGISAWNVKSDAYTKQNDLIISDLDEQDEPLVTVDKLEVAQFIYLLLKNEKVRDIIDTITSKAVLILGRFTKERKPILDLLRKDLRNRNFTPILFDFDKPVTRNMTETVSTIAHMARFVIADITDAKSIPQELQRFVPDLPSLPVQPVILDSQYQYSIFKDFLDYPWVLLPYRYENANHLISSLAEKVIGPPLAECRKIEERRKQIQRKLAEQ